MSIIRQKEEKYENGDNYHQTSDTAGTSARTRPFSYAQIMSKRTKQKIPENAKDETCVLESVSEMGESHNHPKGLKDSTGSDVTKEVLVIKKTSPKQAGHEDSKSFSKDKVKVKSSHDDEVNGENRRRHLNRRVDQSKAEVEKVPEKRLFKATRQKGSKKETEFGEHQRADEKKKIPDSRERSRRPTEIVFSKKYDSGRKVEREPLDKRKVHRYDNQTSKRKRSRSRELHRARERSLSRSPKGHKRSTRERDHGNEPNHVSKYSSGRQNSKSRNYRTSGSSRQESPHYRRQESSLGGYSPRKRKPEAAASKIPSPPPAKLPEKEAKWDLPPSGVNNTSLSLLGNNTSLSLSGTIQQSAAADTSAAVPAVSLTSIDSVHLTQATRSLRSLYMENLPPLSTEKSLLLSLNGFLLEAGASHIPGSQPCIGCIINKEKNQAVVEFLTPEDATAALAFNGKSISGSILQFRRPRDYVDATATTGVHEKPVPALNEIDDTVYDSPHKIFVGGVSESLSSDELLAIVSAFGPVKAYHFEFSPTLSQSCAFLEYVDHSITQKACAGINGLKLGGHIITAVRVVIGADVAEGNAATASYSVPDHAKPLLEDPTQVLKLKNLLDQESVSGLSEEDMEEILEDVRLECARFGTIKSTNLVRPHPRVNEEDRQQPLPHDESLNGKPDLISDSQEVTDLPTRVNREEADLSQSGNGDSPKMKSLDEAGEELEVGCMLVEFVRKEAACTAAHVLNGRLYDGRVISVAYVDHEVYMSHFPR